MSKTEAIIAVLKETPNLSRREIAEKAGCTIARVGEVIRAGGVDYDPKKATAQKHRVVKSGLEEMVGKEGMDNVLNAGGEAGHAHRALRARAQRQEADWVLHQGLCAGGCGGVMTELIQTQNGYLLCPRHADEWQRGGNDVSMWPASEAEIAEGGGVCVECAQCDEAGDYLDSFEEHARINVARDALDQLEPWEVQSIDQQRAATAEQFAAAGIRFDESHAIAALLVLGNLTARAERHLPSDIAAVVRASADEMRMVLVDRVRL